LAGDAPDPARELTALPSHLAGFKGPFMGRKGKGGERERRKRKGRGCVMAVRGMDAPADRTQQSIYLLKSALDDSFF